MSQSHTATQEWQSFELRMRRRRAERCLVRAAAALDAGVLDAAREALEEAQGLRPGDPEVQAVAARLAAAESAPPGDLMPQGVAPELHLPLHPTAVGTPVADAPPARRFVRAFVAAGLILASAGAGWLAVRTRELTGNVPASAAAASAGRQGATAPTPPPVAPVPATPGPDERSVTITQSSIVVPAAPEPDVPPRRERPAGAAAAGPSPDAVAAPRPAPSDPTSPARGEITSGGHPVATAGDEPPAAVATTARAEVPPPVRVPLPEPLPINAAPPLPLPETAVRALPAAGPAVADTGAAAPVAPDRLVRGVLSRYEAAYSQLDAAAAGSVWPSVDRRALARAFEGLSSQSVNLGTCDVRVNGPSAQVDCTGTASWTPKVGGERQSASRRWRFDLRDEGGEWVIVQARVR